MYTVDAEGGRLGRCALAVAALFATVPASALTVPASNFTVGTGASSTVVSGNPDGNTVLITSNQTADLPVQTYYSVGPIQNHGTFNNGNGTAFPWLRIMGPAATFDNYGTANNLSDLYVQDISVLGTNATPGSGSIYNHSGGTFNNGSGIFDPKQGAYGYGSISSYDLSTITNDGTFNNYSYLYTFKNNIDNSGIVNNGQFNNYAPKDSFGPTMDLEGSLTNTGTLHNAAGAAMTMGGTFTNAATGVFINEGSYESSVFGPTNPGTLINQGRVEFRASATGQSPNFYAPGHFIQQPGGTLIVDGRFVESRFEIQGGTVSGSGTLDTTHSDAGSGAQNVLIGPGSTLNPGSGIFGNSANNRMTIVGNLSLTGTFEIGLGGGGSSGAGQGTQYSFLHVLGDGGASIGLVNLGGVLTVDLAPGFTSQVGNYYDILQADGGLNGVFASPATFTDGGYTFEEAILGNTLRLDVIAAVPELPSGVLLGCGALLTLIAARRRRFVS